MAYIERRRNLWYALLTIPEDVRGKLDKLRFVQSLGTPDKAEAMILAAPLLAKWKAEIREARGAHNALTEEANRWKKHLLRQTSVDQERGDEFGTGALELHDLLRERTEALAKTKGALVADTFHGVVTGKLTTTGAYETEWKAQLQATPKTKDQMEKDLPLLIARFTSLEEISKSSVKKWLDDLRSQGKSVATLDRILCAARNYWKYLQSHDVVPVELTPFKGVLDLTKTAETKAKKRGKVANLPYDPKEVVRLYKAAEAGWGKRPAPDLELASLIKLGAYTGARIEELCSLKVSSIKKDAFYIGESKTAAGIREVPIHSELKALVKSLKDASTDGYLLSGLTFNKFGDRSNAIGKRFGRLKESLGFDASHTFHSFRATVITQLENADVSENLAADIVGHEKPRITYGLYSGGASMAVKREAVERLQYPFNEKEQGHE